MAIALHLPSTPASLANSSDSFPSYSIISTPPMSRTTPRRRITPRATLISTLQNFGSHSIRFRTPHSPTTISAPPFSSSTPPQTMNTGTPTADLDFIIADRQRLDITSLTDLANYHTHFLAVTNFLISKHRLSQIEQQRAYPRGFPPALWSKISHRLHLKFIDHYLDDPYPITDVYAAARFVLHSTRSTSPTLSSTAPSPTPSTLDPVVNTAQLGTILAEFTKSIVAAINSTHRRPRAASSLADTAPRKLECTFCGKNHFIRNCDLVEEYRLAGKLKHSIDGKVILPTGAFVPRCIPGRYLKERIDEWHRRHPGQLAAASISYGTMLHSVPTSCAAPSPLVSTYSCTQSPAEVRITELEAEIARLRSKRPDVTSPINARLQPYSTAAPTTPTRKLSPAPRIARLDHSFAQSSRSATYSPTAPHSTLPFAVPVPAFAHSAPHHSFSVPFSPRVVQQSAPPSDTTYTARPAFVGAPSSFTALRNIPNDVYFGAEHVQTAHSLSRSSPSVALAPGDQEHVSSLPAPPAALSTRYSESLGLVAIVPAHTSITAPPCRSDTPPSSIWPFTSLSTVAHASEPQEHVAPHSDRSNMFQTCTETASVTNTQSDSSLAVAPCLVDQEHITPSLTRSAAPPRVPTLPPAHAASIDTPISNLAPLCRSYAPPLIIQPSTSSRAASNTIEPRKQRPSSSDSPSHIPTRSPSPSVANTPHISAKSLYTSSLFIPTSPPLPTSSPPRFSSYKTPHRFRRRLSRCATRSVRANHFYSPFTSSFARPRSPVDPLLQYTSRRLDASHTHTPNSI